MTDFFSTLKTYITASFKHYKSFKKKQISSANAFDQLDKRQTQC